MARSTVGNDSRPSMRSMMALSTAAGPGPRRGPAGMPSDDGDGDRHDAHQQRGAGAVDDPAQDVAAEVVGAQQVGPRPAA